MNKTGEDIRQKAFSKPFVDHFVPQSSSTVSVSPIYLEMEDIKPGPSQKYIILVACRLPNCLRRSLVNLSCSLFALSSGPRTVVVVVVIVVSTVTFVLVQEHFSFSSLIGVFDALLDLLVVFVAFDVTAAVFSLCGRVSDPVSTSWYTFWAK